MQADCRHAGLKLTVLLNGSGDARAGRGVKEFVTWKCGWGVKEESCADAIYDAVDVARVGRRKYRDYLEGTIMVLVDLRLRENYGELEGVGREVEIVGRMGWLLIGLDLW